MKHMSEEEYWYKEYMKSHALALDKISNGIQVISQGVEKHDTKMIEQHAAHSIQLNQTMNIILKITAVLVIGLLSVAVGEKALKLISSI